jgi:hypothetical protein
LQRSAKFTALLPADRHTNFSGAVYHAVGSLLAPLANTVQLTPEQRKSLAAVAGADTPTLVLLYGEQDRIEVASKGTFFGVGLEKFLGLEPGKKNIERKRVKAPA